MTASSLSNREAHLVADIVREAERMEQFLDGVTREAFLANVEKLYAVEKALQNMCEACIQLDGKAGQHRFAALFPRQSLPDIKLVGDRVRHDYGNMHAALIWEQVETLKPSLVSDAEAILAAQRRMRGRPDEIST